MLRYNLYPSRNERPLNKWLLAACNLFIFLVALGMLDLGMKNIPQPRNTPVVSENPMVVSESSIVPVEKVINEVRTQVLEPSRQAKAEPAPAYRPKDVWESIRPWKSFIEQYSKQFGVDPLLVSAVLYIESKGDPNIISPRGALGLMQITPTTARSLGIEDILDPEENIRAGVKYISFLIGRYDEASALLAYNAGAGILDENHIPKETKRFVEQVLALRSFLKDGKKHKELS
jgi:soluble lytic murein transglycosylase-like protein